VPRLFGVRVPRPRVRPALLLLAGVAANLLAWRIVNWSHYTQSNFLESVSQAGRTKFLNDQLVKALGGHPAPVTLSAWLSDRLVSVGNTLVPLRLFFFSAHDPAINAINPACFPFCAGSSPAVVHFFFQYWTTVPYGFAIAFLPLLLQSMWRATRRWPWPVTAAVIVPFLVFAVYWGGDSTGLLREGLQTWVLTVLVVVALEQQREHFGAPSAAIDGSTACCNAASYPYETPSVRNAVLADRHRGGGCAHHLLWLPWHIDMARASPPVEKQHKPESPPKRSAAKVRAAPR
jgi:hypothetical protein